MDVRGAEPDDGESIRRIAEHAWDVAYDGILEGHVVDETVEDWYSPEFLDGELSRSGVVFLVAVEDGEDGQNGEVIGFAHGAVDDGEGDVIRLYVDPDRWGDGVGTRLFERIREELERQGAERLRAMVLADNEIGNGFYRSLGFEREATARTTIDGEEYDENTYTMAI